jgi:hypothetical protein
MSQSVNAWSDRLNSGLWSVNTGGTHITPTVVRNHLLTFRPELTAASEHTDPDDQYVIDNAMRATAVTFALPTNN